MRAIGFLHNKAARAVPWVIAFGVLVMVVRTFWIDRRITADLKALDATIVHCYQSRGQGLIIEYEFMVDGITYRSKSPCQECRAQCSAEACCTGMKSRIEFAGHEPELSRIVGRPE